VDPQNESDAPTAFGYKQLLHEPIMGGGFWTSLAIPLVIIKGGVFVLGIVITAMFFWTLLLILLKRKPK
jgi:ESS family glutamate:Na+ symporter